MTTLHLAPILFGLVVFSPTQSSEPTWELEKSKHGVDVFTRIPEGASIKEFRAETVIRTDISNITGLIEDPANYPAWQSNVKHAEYLQLPGVQKTVMYVEMSMPWPVKNRYIILGIDKQEGADGIVGYDMQTFPVPYDPGNKAIRLNEGYGAWSLVPDSKGNVRVTSSFYVDPQTAVPDWLVNMFIVDGPFRMLSNMREMLDPGAR